MTVYYDRASDFHPLACFGPGQCIHCDREKTYHPESIDGKRVVDHDPKTCQLCSWPVVVKNKGQENEEKLKSYSSSI